MKLIAWDFDGVLNRGFAGGFVLWQQGFEADLGVSATEFTEYMFGSGRLADVLIGRHNLLDLVRDWVAISGVHLTADQMLDYWLQKDARLDGQVLDWLARSPCPGVIATNNEAHRADFIWNQLGFAARMLRIFASGPLGVRKPDAGFFEAIEHWSGLEPVEILLIDDAEKNTAAARARGWQSFHFHEGSRDKLPEVLGITA